MRKVLTGKTQWLFSILLLIIAGLFLWAYWGASRLEDRVYTIDWESDPPFQAPGSNGQATGLAKASGGGEHAW